MIQVPSLSLSEIRQEVERLFERPHRAHVVALYGSGSEATFEAHGRRWRVVPTSCELDLRGKMPEPSDKVGVDGTQGLVLLVDWTSEVLPLDVACRLAGGRLYHVARDARLGALFGARMVEPGLTASALGRVFLSGQVTATRKIQGLRLTRADMCTQLLETKVRMPADALGSAARLLVWAATSEAGPAWVRTCERDELWRQVRREVHEWLSQELGEVGQVIWLVFERDRAGQLRDVLPLLAELERAEPLLAGKLLGSMSAWFGEIAGEVRARASALGAASLVDAVLPRDRAALIKVMTRTQALASEAGLDELAASSSRLPGGHVRAERRFAAAIEALVAARSSQPGGVDEPKLTELLSAIEAIERHLLDTALRAEDHREARRNLARLALWLAMPLSADMPGARWQPAADRARRYSEEGGFLEWARQTARGMRGADTALQSAARTLDATVCARIREQHRAFAEGYVRWLEANKPSGSVVPIEDIGKQVIGPFLEGDRRRKLLVILMDGMSQAAATQLLVKLGLARWGPIAWRRDGWHGTMPLPPVLAVAPTLTPLSRGAFFAGKAEAKFGNEPTERDAARWAQHRALSAYLGEVAPPLFQRRDLLAGHDLASDIREAIEGPSRVVGVIVNAIDEELSGSVQVGKDYSKAPILPLEALLSAAEEGERVVLLASDHGHVLGDSVEVVGGRLQGRKGGARWRGLLEGDEPADGEVVLPKSAWVPAGAERVAVLWDPGLSNVAPSYGMHGGVSLDEVVAPAILIAPDWLEHRVPDDPSLAVRPLPTPDWWELRVRRAPAQPRVEVVAQGPRQESLFEPTPTVTRVVSPVPPLVESLKRSTIFQAQVKGVMAAEVERILQWVGVLSEAGGALSAGEFAAAAGVRAHQVGGVVARMGVLNADGFAMVEHDHIGRRVVLHRSRLAQHYGLEGKA